MRRALLVRAVVSIAALGSFGAGLVALAQGTAPAGANLPLDGVSVLGRLTCRLVAPIEPGVAHTVVAWPISDDGRKHLGGCAIHAPDGALCAYSAGLWIELRDPATMGAQTRD